MLDEIHYIDRIRILFYDDKGFMDNIIDTTELNKHCENARITTTTKTVYAKTHCKSKLDMIVPEPHALQLLAQYCQNIDHKISYIEVAHDALYPTEAIAKSIADAKIKCAHKLYAKECFIYDRNNDDKVRPRLPGIFSDRTGYYGEKNKFIYVIYARNSKPMIFPFPCSHDEFRIQNAARIRKLLGINSITDILCFDIKSNFLKLKKKFIRFEELDHEAHGRFRQDIRKGVDSKVIGRGAGEMLKSERASHHIMRAHDLGYQSQLRILYKKQRKEAQKKLTQGGILTPLGKKDPQVE